MGLIRGQTNSKVHFDVTVGFYADTIIDFFVDKDELVGKDGFAKILGVLLRVGFKHTFKPPTNLREYDSKYGSIRFSFNGESLGYDKCISIVIKACEFIEKIHFDSFKGGDTEALAMAYKYQKEIIKYVSDIKKDLEQDKGYYYSSQLIPRD